MFNWVTSAVLIVALFALTKWLRLDLEESILVCTIIWFTVGFVFFRDGGDESQIKDCEIHSKFAEDSSSEEESNFTEKSPASTLEGAVEKLAAELRSKERHLDKLMSCLTEREFRRSLSRLVSIHETLGFTLKMRSSGKLSDQSAIEQLRMEIESAISDLGLEQDSITPGTLLSKLPAGSFIVVKVEHNAPEGMAGTVKEVLSQGIFTKDENGKMHFISPSKINAYKI